MPTAGEIGFVRAIGPDRARHALDKPLSDGRCGEYLADPGVLMGLLPPPPARVLDLGVGPGWTTVMLARRGYEVVGQDICADMIELTGQNRDRYAADSASFVVQDYEGLGYRDEFDAAVFYDALHHAEDERQALAAMYAALKPGGLCLTVETGEGHAAASGEAVAAFGVTEMGMPPHRVVAAGRSVGFRSFRVYARAAEPVPLYGFEATAPTVPAKPGRLRVAAGFARKALRSLARGARDADRAFFHRLAPDAVLRTGNVVWMRK